MDVQLAWLLILIGTVMVICLVVLAVVLDIRARAQRIELLKAEPLSDAKHRDLLQAIRDRDNQRSVFEKAVDARLRDMTKITRDFLTKLNRIFYPEPPSSPPVSKRPESPDKES